MLFVKLFQTTFVPLNSQYTVHWFQSKNEKTYPCTLCLIKTKDLPCTACNTYYPKFLPFLNIILFLQYHIYQNTNKKMQESISLPTILPKPNRKKSTTSPTVFSSTPFIPRHFNTYIHSQGSLQV